LPFRSASGRAARTACPPPPSRGGDDTDGDVDTLTAFGIPVDVAEVQQQRQFVDDYRVRGTVGHRRRWVSPPRFRPPQADAATVASMPMPML
jgi:hypothetical protein